jgi:hypothetical protein
VIALETTGDDVIPGFAASSHNGHDMVKGEIFRGAFFPAVLAGIVIPRVNICPAEFDVLMAFSNLYILQETENAGHFYGKADAPDLAVVFSQNLNLALTQQIQGSLPRDDVDRFIGRIQDQRMFHGNLPMRKLVCCQYSNFPWPCASEKFIAGGPFHG